MPTELDSPKNDDDRSRGVGSNQAMLASSDGDLIKEANPLHTTAVVTESELPSGAATEAKQNAVIAELAALAIVIGSILTAVGLILLAVNGKVSAGNSSDIPLVAGATFTGEAVSTLDEGIIYINISTDQASATDGLSIEQSSDGVNWDHTDNYTITAGANKNFSINPHSEFLRVVYTNGATPQTYLRLQTIIKSNALPSSHRIKDPIIDDDDATLQKSVLTALIDGDGFGNIGATASGNLRVTDAESGLAIAKDDVVGTSFIHKFGAAPDFDTSDGFVTVWDGAEDDTAWELMEYVYSSTADIDTCSSSNAGDTQTLEVQGLDANYDLVTQTKTLDGQNKVTLDTPLIRTFRARNANSTDFAGHIFCYVDGTITTGIPDTNSDIRIIVQPGNNQTVMSVFTVPAGKTGYMRDWYASTAGGSKLASYVFRVEARPFGGVFQLKHISSLTETGSSYVQHTYIEPEIFEEKTDIQMEVFADASPAAVGASVSAGFDIVLVDN